MIKSLFVGVLLLLLSFNLFAEVCGEVTYKDRGVDRHGGIHYTVWLGISDKKYEEFQVDAPIYASVEVGDETCLSKTDSNNGGGIFLLIIFIVLAFILLVGVLS